MKILFFCGSLEPGRDGVGDYTRRLADECTAQGHDCCVIALHDPHVTRTSEVNVQQVRLIRLPASEPWPDRLSCVIRHLWRLAPDWVSWQLVAYGFHPRGFLPAALLRTAPELRGPRCHVMLHELWLGLEAGAPWSARTQGWLQRRGVLCLLDQLDPDCLHTSQAAYQQALKREGFDSGVLALFGNVPVADHIPGLGPPLAHWLPAPTAPQRTAPLVVLTFGTLHPQWRPAATVEWLLATARRLARAPALVIVGRTGTHAPAVLGAFRQHGIHVGVTGELDPAAVSALLQTADLGIASHPWELIGKSGTAAAMLEHGLPVLVPRDDWKLRRAPAMSSAPSDPLLARLDGLDASRTDHWLAARRSPASGLRRIASNFLETLTLNSAEPARPQP